MEIEYIVVQAGGKGSRLGKLTRNKPKALVPVDNLPLLFHLFRKYPNKKFIVIGDYLYDVLERYLDTFAEADYTLIDARGHQGTCSGLRQAFAEIPRGEAFMLIWCDLVLPEDYEFPEKPGNYVGISGDFVCRWKYENHVFAEEPSAEYGVAGHFIFTDKTVVEDVPEEGEFVRWLGEKGLLFASWKLRRTKEYGVLSAYAEQEKKCRPFNRITQEGACIVKEPLDEQGRQLAVREKRWYARVGQYRLSCIPRIYQTDPLRMEKIDGVNIYEYAPAHEEKRQILRKLVGCLKAVHALEGCPADAESYYEAYIGKTYKRLDRIRGLVPFADDRTVRINGADCPNIFYLREEVEKRIERYMPDEFRLLHGDCTFSNMLLRQDGTPVLIDPRGYFGTTEYYGDPAYDWVKLYYSIAGNYDQFNLKRFTLRIESEEVWLETESNHWEDMEDEFFNLLAGEVSREQIRLLHALVWLSLTTYAWEDYDSVCGAFYRGLYLLREVMEQ